MCGIRSDSIFTVYHLKYSGKVCGLISSFLRQRKMACASGFSFLHKLSLLVQGSYNTK